MNAAAIQIFINSADSETHLKMLRRGRRIAHEHINIGEFSVNRVAIVLRHVPRQERDGRIVLFLGSLELGQRKDCVEAVGIYRESLRFGASVIVTKREMPM